MGQARFAGEKDEAVAGPAREGVSTAPATPVRTPPAPRKALSAGADPFLTAPYRDLRIVQAADVQRMVALAAPSRTFAAHQAALTRLGLSVEYRVEPLDPALGGGWTEPDMPRFIMRLDPATVAAGFHIFDVFLHEHGHIDTDRRRIDGLKPGEKRYFQFHVAVQKELGLRPSADSHLPEAKR